MKKSKFLIVSSLLSICLCYSVDAQIEVDEDGLVSIGDISPDTHQLLVDGYVRIKTGSSSLIIDNSGYYNNPAIYGGQTLGKSNQPFYDVYSYNYPSVSDKRQKENILSMTNSLSLIMQLQSVRFDYLRESVIFNSLRNSLPEEQLDAIRKNRVGFIAQDVEKVIPEVVQYDDSTDIYSIDYMKFTPFLVEAIKEQQVLIENLQNEIDFMKGSEMKSLVSGTEKFDMVGNCVLHQNAPNPFGETTSIRYNLPEGISDADIIIYDMTGKQLQRIPLTESGESRVNISAGELDSGMYMYSMIVENHLIDTKQMILTTN